MLYNNNNNICSLIQFLGLKTQNKRREYIIFETQNIYNINSEEEKRVSKFQLLYKLKPVNESKRKKEKEEEAETYKYKYVNNKYNN